MPVVEPKYTMAELEQLYTKQNLGDRMRSAVPLPGITTNAEYAESHPNADKDPTSSCYGAKNFDPDGIRQNAALKAELLAVFKKYKKSDASGRHFLLAWRHYPNA